MKCPFNFPKKKPEEINSECWLKVFRLHPSGVGIEKANNKLNGDANEGAVKYCGPYIHANQAGWWLTSPVDVDITYRGNGKYDEKFYSEYEPLEKFVIKSSLRPNDKFRDEGRTLIGKGNAAPEVYQIWTGCIFRTPPGWGLHVRTPINFTEVHRRPFWIQEGMLETDWMAYDIWINLEFHTVNQTVSLRRNMWPPLAQIIPVRRESYQSKWSMTDEILDSSREDHKDVWDFWQEYNWRKWKAMGEKDTRTYHKTRKEAMRHLYPNQEVTDSSPESLPNEDNRPSDA